MSNIIYRSTDTPDIPTSDSVKGSPLTNIEIDGNFKSIAQHLSDLDIHVSAAAPSVPPDNKLWYNTTDEALLMWYNDAWVEVGGSGGIEYIKVTSNYTAEINEGVIADSNAGTFNITLPATPEIGSLVSIVDGDNFYNNNVIVLRNGNTINDLAEDVTLNVAGIKTDFIYDGVTWNIYT